MQRLVRPLVTIAVGGAIAVGVSAGALATAPAPFPAEDPVNVGGDPFVDETGDYSGDDQELTEFLTQNNTASDGDVYVVVVDSFDGMGREQWAVDTAETSGLGSDDLLIAIAMGDREWGYANTDAFPLSRSEIEALGDDVLEPDLGSGDVAGAVMGFSNAVTESIASGGQDNGGTEVNVDAGAVWPVVGLVGGAAVIGVGALLISRGAKRAKQRREQREVVQQQQLGLEELKQRADIALVQLDDTVQQSEQELAFAGAQFGEQAVQPYREALERAKGGLAEAFGLQQQLDDAFPDSDQERHDWSSRILQIAQGAGDELASHAASFGKLRNLEQNAPQVLETVAQSRAQLDGRIGNAEQILDRLDDQHAGASIDPVRENIAGAQRQLPTIDEAIATGRAAVQAGDGAKAALAVHAAEAALAQASGLLAAVERAEQDLAVSSRQLDELVQDSIGDVATAKSLPRTQTDLRPLIDLVEQHVREAQQRPVDTLTVLANLQRANQRLDEATGQAREHGEQRRRAEQDVDRWITSARANIARAEDYIHTRRIGVGTRARQLLATAQQELAEALRAQRDDPATASNLAERASRHAEEAMQSAGSDVDRWSGPQNPYYDGGGGRGQDMLTGGLLGYILGDMMSGRGGGWGGDHGGDTSASGGGPFSDGGGGGLGDIFSGGGGGFGGGGGGGFFGGGFDGGGGFGGGGGDFGGGGGGF